MKYSHKLNFSVVRSVLSSFQYVPNIQRASRLHTMKDSLCFDTNNSALEKNTSIGILDVAGAKCESGE